MVFGVGLLVIGYAIFYWGLHHFLPLNPAQAWPRYSLWCVMGLNKLNLPSTAPFRICTAGDPNCPQPQGTAPGNTQQQNPNNNQTPTKSPPKKNPSVACMACRASIVLELAGACDKICAGMK